MMSEKRYGVHDCPNGFYYLRDVTDHSVYIHRNYGYLYSPYKEDIELVSTLLNELADKVDGQQATITKQKKKIKRLKDKLEEALDEWDYWKTMTESYRKSIKLDLEECIIIQGDKKFKGKICKMVRYEDKLTIDLRNTEEVIDDE